GIRYPLVTGVQTCALPILKTEGASSVDKAPGSRRGRMQADSAMVEEVPVWLEVNGEPMVTWMCTPDLLEELAVGWLHGEGFIERSEERRVGKGSRASGGGK